MIKSIYSNEERVKNKLFKDKIFYTWKQYST